MTQKGFNKDDNISNSIAVRGQTLNVINLNIMISWLAKIPILLEFFYKIVKRSVKLFLMDNWQTSCFFLYSIYQIFKMPVLQFLIPSKYRFTNVYKYVNFQVTNLRITGIYTTTCQMFSSKCSLGKDNFVLQTRCLFSVKIKVQGSLLLKSIQQKKI